MRKKTGFMFFISLVLYSLFWPNLMFSGFVTSVCVFRLLLQYCNIGVFFINSRTLKCSLDAAKRGFYRAANSIFGKVGRTASEEVVLHLVKYKCMPILLYGFEVLNLNKSQLNSLDFVANLSLIHI